MWEKFSFFGWSTKKPTVQPVQREVSVTLTNGDRRETIQRSPSGTKMVSSSSTKHGLDDDNSSEASTSLNFGFKGGSPRRNSSYSFSREPLDLPTWSNVTSPGFTSRLVQQASGNSPLKEFNDSLSHSPFRKSPHRDLQLGELPFVSYTRRPSSPVFPSPHRTSSLRSGVSSSVYNRDRRRNARQGQTFVRIAPIDPSMKANVSISRNSSSPPHGMGNNSAYPPRGSPRATSEPYRNEGLGGIPQQELAMRFNRLWPSTPGGPVPGPGRPSSPTSPSNIMDALAIGRKRTREQDTYYPPNATPPSVSPPSKISIGIGDTPVRPQVSKRVKFLGGPDGHDRPMMVGYSGMGAGDNEHLSSESILEQMNQTEKRFLPDSTSTPYSMQKKNIRMPGCDDQPSALHSALRKRRSQTSIMSAVEDEARGEKAGRFCMCNECYAEAAGISISSQDQSLRKDGSTSPMGSDEKSTNTGDSRSRETCDKGVSTIEFDRGAYFREVFRKADKKKPAKDDDLDELMPYGKTVITKEMYERDKRKRIERYYRILNMKPPGGNIFDPCPGNNSTTPASTASSVTSISNDTTDVAASGTSATNGSNFGSPPPPASTTGGFSFGRQTSPIAPTITTTACTTITSPSSTGLFGASTAPTLSTNATFGVGGSTSALSTTVTPSPGLPSFGSPPAPSQISFSRGSDLLEKPKPPVAATESVLSTASSATGPSSGFSFAPATTASTSAAATTSTPSFGIGASATSPAPVSSNPESSANTAVPAFGGFGSPANPGASLFGSSSASTSSTGDNNNASNAATTTTVSLGIPNFSFGKTSASSGSSTNPTTGNTSGSITGAAPAPSFSFGGSNNNQTGSASIPPLFGQSSGKPTDSVDSKSGSSNTAASSGGFNFSGSVAGGASSSATTPSTTAPSAFGGVVATSSLGNPTTTALSGPTAEASVTSNPPTFGGTGSVFGQTTAPSTTTSSGSFGTTFGSSGTTTASTGFSFGGNTGSSGAGGFSFSGGSNPSTTISSLATSPASTFGSGSGAVPTFGSTTSTTKSGNAAPSAAPTFGGGGNIFGQSATPTTTAPTGSFGTTFGSGGTTTANTGFSFGGGSTGAGSSSGGFSFSGGANPSTTISSLATSPPAFGGNTATNTFSAPSAFGSTSSTAKPGADGSSATPTFGTSGSLFGQAATSTTTASGGSFGSTFGSTGGTTTGSGFAFGGNAPSTGGFSFSGGANPSTTTASALATSPTSAFGGGAQPPAFNATPAFGSNTSTAPAGTGASSNPPAFGGSAPVFGQTATATPAASFGTGFGTGATPAPANTGFAFGGAATPTQGTAPSTPFQFGQQAAQGVPGGFNFAASAPAPSPGGGPAMFSMGSASTAPRRRDVRRRHVR